MPLNVLEVAVYALVLLGGEPRPFSCESNLTGVRCSHEIAAFPGERDSITFSNGIRVTKERKGLQFSNGIEVQMDSAGWIQFSNGVSARRSAANQFRFNNGMACLQRAENEASCLRVRQN